MQNYFTHFVYSNNNFIYNQVDKNILTDWFLQLIFLEKYTPCFYFFTASFILDQMDAIIIAIHFATSTGVAAFFGIDPPCNETNCVIVAKNLNRTSRAERLKRYGGLMLRFVLSIFNLLKTAPAYRWFMSLSEGQISKW